MLATSADVRLEAAQKRVRNLEVALDAAAKDLDNIAKVIMSEFPNSAALITKRAELYRKVINKSS